MNCPGCHRDNDPARRYCGGCGCNFEPACAGCGFANDPIDRFCGGCGAALRTVESRPIRAHAAHPMAAPVAPRPAITVATGWANELADLLEPAASTGPAVEETDLPEAGINQEDVDRLFGGAS